MVEIWHKTFLLFVKYVPFIIATVYLIINIASCFGITLIILPNLFYMSPITALFIIAASFAFKFCIWHRLPIYYALLLQGIATIDYYSNVLITSNIMLFVYLIITLIFILLGMYLKNKYNKKKYEQNRNT